MREEKVVRGSEIKSYIYFLDENSFFNSLPRWRLKKIQKCFSSRISRLKISSFQGGSVFLSQFFFFCKSEVEEQQRRKEQEEPKPPKTLASGVCIIKLHGLVKEAWKSKLSLQGARAKVRRFLRWDFTIVIITSWPLFGIITKLWLSTFRKP